MLPGDMPVHRLAARTSAKGSPESSSVRFEAPCCVESPTMGISPVAIVSERQLPARIIERSELSAPRSCPSESE
ncbi:MAG: hypothetical protein ACLR3C_01815 [Eggerthella lenta]